MGEKTLCSGLSRSWKLRTKVPQMNASSTSFKAALKHVVVVGADIPLDEVLYTTTD